MLAVRWREMVILAKEPSATLVKRASQANNVSSNGEKDEEEEEEEGERNENGEEPPSSPPTPQLLMDCLTASLKKVS